MIGIYIIKCNCNGKGYIGQSIDIKKRISEHKSALRHSRHSNSYLQNAFNKYGEKEFSFDILREISPQEYTKQYLDSLEIYYIDLYKSNIINDGFNIESGGNGAGRASEETRKKPWFHEVDVSKYLAYIIAAINHNKQLMIQITQFLHGIHVRIHDFHQLFVFFIKHICQRSQKRVFSVEIVIKGAL